MQIRSIAVNLLCVAAGLLVGVVTGAWGPQQSQAPAADPMSAVITPPASSCPPVVPHPTPAGPGIGVNLEDLRGIVREELRAALSSGTPPGNENPAEDESRQEDEVLLGEQRQRAHDEATQLLGRARLHGAWTHEDRQAFRVQIQTLTIPQQDALIGELFTAIQRGQLKVEGAGPPL